MIGYKLTDANARTHDSCQWGIGITHEATEPGVQMCTNQVIHWYTDPLLAVFANPIHANYNPARLWECEVGEKVNGDALKSASKSVTTLRELPLPVISTEQRVEIAIRLVLPKCRNKKWLAWATKWLKGSDRTNAAAYAAAYAADATAIINLIHQALFKQWSDARAEGSTNMDFDLWKESRGLLDFPLYENWKKEGVEKK